MWKDRIKIGSFVKTFDMDMEEENTYHIISGTKENENDLSFDSPLGKALLDNELGAIITVKAEEEYKVKIISVDNSKVKSVVETFNSINNNSKPKANTLIRNLNKGYGTRAQDIYDVYLECYKFYMPKRRLQKNIVLGFCLIIIGRKQKAGIGLIKFKAILLRKCGRK